MQITIIAQGINGNNLEKHLKEFLKDDSVIGCRSLIAFVTLDGLLKLGTAPEGPLYKFVTSPDRKFELIIGVDSVTTPDALKEINRLSTAATAKYSVRAFSNSSRQLFHPKVYIFDKRDGNSTIFIGSNNLTPGGLHNNIEVCTKLDNLNPKEMVDWNDLWKSFSTHSDVKDIDSELLNRVILRHQKELEHIRRRPRPKISLTKQKVRKGTVETSIVEPSIVEPSSTNTKILVRYIPRAGGRVSQVHFTKEIAEHFFSLPVGKGGMVDVQQVQPGQSPQTIEERKLVYSEVNKNPKIELRGAKSLVKNYPSKKRPIVIFEQVDPKFYRYMLLMPGENGYREVSHRLDTQPKGVSLPSWITDLDSLVGIWSGYPH